MNNVESMLTLNPALRRAFAMNQRDLKRGETAFLLGAGIDILIAHDFIKDKTLLPPNWTSLICALSPFKIMTGAALRKKAQLKRIAETWPAEAASLARWWTGDEKFRLELKKLLGPSDECLGSIKSELTEEKHTYKLCSLLMHSNLIITANYSSYLVEALRVFSEKCGLKKAIIVLDREDMQSLPFPERDEKDKIFVVHMHGRCSERSFPILDAWGYNILGHDDAAYINFLRDLFTRRSVVTIGNSWTDPPLRSAAAFVQRTKPYLSRRHLAFYFVSDRKTFGKTAQEPQSNDLTRSWSNVMRAAYGINVLFVDSETQCQWFANLETNTLHERTNDNNVSPRLPNLAKRVAETKRAIGFDLLKECADFFDGCGDYESPLQHEFLSSIGRELVAQENQVEDEPGVRRLTQHGSRTMVDLLLNHIKSPLMQDDNNWQIAARLERHLRHHSYLYVRPLKNNPREEMWHELWNRAPELEEWAHLSPQLRFDFLIGKYELKNQKNVETGDHEMNLEHLSQRFNLGKSVWQTLVLSEQYPWRSQANHIQLLAHQLLESGWESAAAKVLGDRVHLLSVKASESGLTPEAPIAKDIVEQAHQANSIARASGCFRRQIKVDSIGAMWNPDPFEGRVQLLGNIRAAEAMQSIEPGILGGLGAGLLVCELRARKRSSEDLGSIETIEHIANELFEEIGLKGYLQDALEYWIKFAPKPIREMLNGLCGKLNIIPQS